MERLDGIRAKLNRANEHLHTLRDQAARLLSESEIDPYDVVSEYNASTGHCLVHVKLNVLPPRFDWGLTAAECAYHLRSALDQVIWQLIDSEGRDPKVLRTQFPIYDDRDKFVAQVEKPAPKDKGPLAGFAIGGPAWALIEAAQPYHAPNSRDHPLFGLHFLNNTDKHQVLHATFGELHTKPINKAQAFTPVRIRLITEGRSTVTFSRTIERAVFHDGRAPLFEARFAPPFPAAVEVEMEGDLFFQVRVGERRPGGVTGITFGALQTISDDVRDLVESFAPLLA